MNYIMKKIYSLIIIVLLTGAVSIVNAAPNVVFTDVPAGGDGCYQIRRLT